MLSQAIRASHRGLTCLARQQAANTRRAFASTSQQRADLIQDMYIKNLKDTKPTPVQKGDEKGQVKEFKAPQAPKSPEEGDLAGDLKSYESQQPEMEGQAAEGEASAEHSWLEDDGFDLQKEIKESGEASHH